MKATVKAHTDSRLKDKAYSVETVEVLGLEEGLDWLNISAQADGYKNAAEAFASSAAGDGIASQPPSSKGIVTPKPNELIEALFHIRNNSFSQSSKGDFYPGLKQGPCRDQGSGRSETE